MSKTILELINTLDGKAARNTSELSSEQIRKLIVQNEIYVAALELIAKSELGDIDMGWTIACAEGVAKEALADAKDA